MQHVVTRQREAIEAAQRLVLAVPVPGHRPATGEVAAHPMRLDVTDGDVAERVAEGFQDGRFGVKA
jgi:hypothetical protein